MSACPTSKPLDKRPVILRRVDANRRLIDDADQERVAVVQNAELLEILNPLDRCPRQLGQAQEKVAAINIKANVLKEMCRIGSQQRIVPVAGKRNRRPAEINRPLIARRKSL